MLVCMYSIPYSALRYAVVVCSFTRLNYDDEMLYYLIEIIQNMNEIILNTQNLEGNSLKKNLSIL